MPRRTLDARWVDLSQATRAVVSHSASGQVGAVMFVRGNQAFHLSDGEARNLLAALKETSSRGTEV